MLSGRLFKPLTALGMSFVILWIITFLDMFVRSTISPAVPYLVKDFVVTEEAVAAIIGLLTSIGAVAMTLANIPGGVLADKIGRKKIIVLSVCIYPLALLCYLLSMNWYWLIFASLIGGLSFGLAQPSFSALIADLIPEKTRATAYGVYNLSWLLSQIPAPIIGGYMALSTGIKIPFLISLILYFFAILLALKIIEPKIKRTRSSQVTENQSQPSTPLMPFGIVLSIFCSMSVLGGFANGMLSAILPTYLIFKLKLDVLQMGVVFSIGFALVSAIVQIPGGKLADKIGRKKLMILGVFGAPLILALSYTQDIIQFILITAIICAVGNISMPASSALLMDLVIPEKRAKASGFSQTAFGTGMAIGPTLGGLLWGMFKPETFVSFLIPSILFLSMAPLILVLKEPTKS